MTPLDVMAEFIRKIVREEIRSALARSAVPHRAAPIVSLEELPAGAAALGLPVGSATALVADNPREAATDQPPADDSVAAGDRATPADGSELPSVLTVDEAAVFLRINRKTLFEAIARGEFPARSIGKGLRISRDVVMQWFHCQDRVPRKSRRSR